MATGGPEGTFGRPQELHFFRTHYNEFLSRLPHLVACVDVAFRRKVEFPTSSDRVVFLLGWLIADDFSELGLLCENGYGIGALKLLRGIYERAVTARYVSGHPKEATDFIEYYWMILERMDKDSIASRGVPFHNSEDFETIKSHVRGIRSRHKGQSERKDFRSWSKKSFKTLAQEDANLWKLYVPAYLIPTFETHATVTNIMSRVLKNNPGGLVPDAAPKRKHAWQALYWGHQVLLECLSLQAIHFDLNELERKLEICREDCVLIWQADRLSAPENSS